MVLATATSDATQCNWINDLNELNFVFEIKRQTLGRLKHRDKREVTLINEW